MTTTLQQLLAELDAAPAGCLDDVRRWVRTLAMEMMQMQAPTGRAWCPHYRDCKTCEPAVQTYDSLVEAYEAERAQSRRLAAERDIARRDLTASLKELDSVCDDRRAARAEVERLTRERDRAQDGLLAVSKERNRIEHETVTAIAAYLRRRAGTIASSSLSRDRLMQAAAAIDNDEWRTK
jgi:hypothetical protein